MVYRQVEIVVPMAEMEHELFAGADRIQQDGVRKGCISVADGLFATFTFLSGSGGFCQILIPEFRRIEATEIIQGKRGIGILGHLPQSSFVQQYFHFRITIYHDAGDIAANGYRRCFLKIAESVSGFHDSAILYMKKKQPGIVGVPYG